MANLTKSEIQNIINGSTLRDDTKVKFETDIHGGIRVEFRDSFGLSWRGANYEPDFESKLNKALSLQTPMY